MPNAAAINKQLEQRINSLEETLRARDKTIKEQIDMMKKISETYVQKEDDHRRFCNLLESNARESEEKLIEGHKRQQQRMKEELEEEHRREINRLKLEHKMKMTKMEKEMELMMSMANKVCAKIEGEKGFDLSGLEYPESPREAEDTESYVSRYEDGSQMVSVSPRICVDDTIQYGNSYCPPPSTSPRHSFTLYEMPDYVKRMSQPSPRPGGSSTQYVFPCYEDGTPMVSTTPR